MELFVTMEEIAMIVIFVIYLFHRDPQKNNNTKYKLFTGCLVIAELSIFLDVITSLIINKPQNIPLWLNSGLNTLYFICMDISFSLIAIYCFYVMFEHTSDKHCYYNAKKVILILLVALLVLVAVNPWNGCLFYYEGIYYRRGPLNRMGYVVLLIEICMLVVCSFRNRKIMSNAMRKLVRLMPPIVAITAVVQIVTPDILLNGTIAAIALLILFISFQSHQFCQDSLTELMNRSLFVEELKERLKKAVSFQVIMVHLKDFDSVNQKYGMKNGDEVLFIVAKYLQQFAPRYQAFRYRNTRFVLLGRKGTNGETCVEEIYKRFQEPWDNGKIRYVLQAGIICMDVSADMKNEKEVIDKLEFAVSHQNIRSEDGVLYFNDVLGEKFERRVYVLDQIRKGLAEDRFQVYFQPVFNCEVNAYMSAESLLRLKDENGTFISPGEFIPLAEKNGLMDELSWVVFRKVCEFLNQNPCLDLKSISVNLSAQQITDAELMNEFYHYLKENLRTDTKICIEITERVVAENSQRLCNMMHRFDEQGVKFYLDDFGMGYSNLASVMELPFAVVKLDRSLILDIGKSHKNYEMVKHLISMLHCADFRVVAEGIEQEDQVVNVKELSVDYIQGYYYARPMPGEEMVSFLAK